MEKEREASEVEVTGWCRKSAEDDWNVLAGIRVEGHWGTLAWQTVLP